MPTQLTTNFNLEEFIASNTATSRGILEQFNPPQNVVANIKALAIQLQKARDIYGKAMIFTSGYRCTRLNKAVGGAKNVELEVLNAQGQSMNLAAGKGLQNDTSAEATSNPDISIYKFYVQYYATAQATAGPVTSSVTFIVEAF